MGNTNGNIGRGFLALLACAWVIASPAFVMVQCESHWELVDTDVPTARWGSLSR
jgi:hypothetical protein